MKKISKARQTVARAGDLKQEYVFDYSKAKPNRFAMPASRGAVTVELDPDVAAVFRDAGAVNSVLRALLETMPPVRR